MTDLDREARERELPDEFLRECERVALETVDFGLDPRVDEHPQRLALSCLIALSTILDKALVVRRHGTRRPNGVDVAMGLSRFISDTGVELERAGELTTRLYALEKMWGRLP